MKHLLEIYCVQLNKKITLGLSYKHYNGGHENKHTLWLYEVEDGNLL